MEFFGDLERLFATSLYPLRVPIAIGMAVAFVAFLWIARRRGWFAAARRHPVRTTALALVLLAVGLPTAWYLGSPLFIRTALDEPPPTAAPTAAPTAGPSAPVEPDMTIAPGGPARTGEFAGADEFHFGSGRATLTETAPGSFTLRFEDFSVRNGPDLYVYLSPDPEDYAAGAVELGTLKATDGNFNYEIPAGTDISGLHSVVIWCKQFAVTFAVAPLR